MAAIGTIIGVVGSVVSAVGTIAAGQANRQAAEFQAQQYDIQAKDELAAAQQDAEALKRQRDVALSRVQAVSAASGLGAADPTIQEIAAEIAGYGKKQEMSALAGGQMRKRQLEYAAASSRATGKAQAVGSLFSAGGTILGGVANAFQQKYGQGGMAAGGAYKPLYG